MEFTGERFIPEAGLESEIECEHMQRYHSVADLMGSKVVLDAASGSGYGSYLLASKAAFVVGLDINQEAIQHAHKKYNAANLRFIQGTISALPFADASVDVVVSFETIEHVDTEIQKLFLTEIKRVLKPDGALVMSSPDKLNYSDRSGYKNEFHVKEFYREEFKNFLSSYFTHIKFYEQFQKLSYILTENDTELLRILNSGAWEKESKYNIALCSNDITCEDHIINTIMIDQKDKYQKTVARVIELQGEIVEKNNIITGLERWVEKCRATLTERDATIQGNPLLQEVRTRVSCLEKENQKLQRTISEERSCTLLLRQQIDHLYSTKGWKILQKIYWLKNKLWPL